MTEIDTATLTDEQLQNMLADEPAEQAPEPIEPQAAAPAEEAAAAEPEAHAKPSVLDDLREERSRRKEAVARMEEMERRFAEFQARTTEYLQALAPQPGQPQPPPVDFNEDPIEYLRRQQEQVGQSLTQLQAQQQELEARRQAEQQWTALTRGVQAAEQAFVAKNPDYYDAVNWARDQYRKQLETRGVPAEHLERAIREHTVALIQQAAHVGLDPATWAYQMARGLGWSPKPVAAAVDPAKAPKSLGGISGRGDAATPSLADISKMSDKDFNALFDKMMVGT